MNAKRHRSPHALEIDIAWRLRTPWRATRLLQRVARHAASAEGFRRGQLSIAVVGARAMATLHRKHLNQEGPTDVLTFDFGCDLERGLLDGEIVLCADVARRRAIRHAGKKRGLAPARAELALYLVHGLLHLAGHDDRDADDFRRIHEREDAILTELAIGAVFRRGD